METAYFTSKPVQGKVIVCGDFNARTGVKDECLILSKQEILEREVDDDMLNLQGKPYDSVIDDDDLMLTGMSRERKNCDKGTNDYTPKLLNLCFACDLIMLNGRFNHCKGKLTFLI